jgi:ribonuclease HI
MSVPAPHFLLRSRASRTGTSGRWSFALQAADGSHSMSIEETEPETRVERLELLALVRGLEALPQPGRVTLVPSSSHVQRVLNSALEEWRTNDWQWERHGEMVPVKNADLWRRIDRALHFHQINYGVDRPYVPEEANRPDTEFARRANDALTATATQPGDPVADRTSDWPRSFKPLVHNLRQRSTWARKILLAGLIVQRRIARRLADCRAAIVRFATDPAAQTWNELLHNATDEGWPDGNRPAAKLGVNAPNSHCR